MVQRIVGVSSAKWELVGESAGCRRKVKGSIHIILFPHGHLS
jgi:hypothetical protein